MKFNEIIKIIESKTEIKLTISESKDVLIEQAENWIEIAGSQSLIKIVIGLIFFLPIYGIILNYLVKKFKIK